LRIVDTELFGPASGVQRFPTKEAVIALANETEHGLPVSKGLGMGAKADFRR
jgi:acyl-CoA reductase-like NAD-dependent aldehyde dehydrogenase